MRLKYIPAAFMLTAVLTTGCSKGADGTQTTEGAGRYFDENGRRIEQTEFDPTYGYGLDSEGKDGENFIDRAADEVRRMGGDVKEAAEDAAGKTSGRDTAKDGYDSPEMSGVNGAGDYTGMAAESQTAMDY